ncbi:hypothetical protein [Longirhabdus pacifica]|uniref:hypothetical protein n=1 Tax=Longirhabdus pacifica TaxID=2305227 RepID=UPI00100884BC|nr:hypothetical protein [Longirhabdus pacifica]
MEEKLLQTSTLHEQFEILIFQVKDNYVSKVKKLNDANPIFTSYPWPHVETAKKEATDYVNHLNRNASYNE